MHGPYPGELRTRVIDFVEEGGSRREAAEQLMSASVLRSGGCSAFVKTGLSKSCPVEGVLRHWRSTRGRSSPSSARNGILRSMRLFRRFTSGESQEVVARCPASSPVMALPSKKSLQAAERKRADVARARRRWIREQGFLDPAHLVFIDETAVTTNMLRLNGWNPRGGALGQRCPDGTLGDGDVYRWAAPNRRRGSDADQRSHEWRGLPGLRRAMFGPNDDLVERDVVDHHNVRHEKCEIEGPGHRRGRLLRTRHDTAAPPSRLRTSLRFMGFPPVRGSAEATWGLVGDQGAPCGRSARINSPRRRTVPLEALSP